MTHLTMMNIKKIPIHDPRIKLSLITIGIALITFVLCQTVVLRPFRARKALLRARLECIEEGGSVARLSRQVSSLEKSLLPQKDPSWLLTQMTDLAQQSQLNIKSIEPLPARPLPPYSYTSVKIATISSFSQLLQFLYLVETSLYTFNIENLTITSQEKHPFESKKNDSSQTSLVQAKITIGIVHLRGS